MSLIIRTLCGLLVAGLWTPVLSAALVVQGYTPGQHDRFANDPAFIGASYDWSGVGLSSAGQWGVLVTPSFTLSATHAAPVIGSSMRFYKSNDPSGPWVDRQVVQNVPITQLGFPANSDLVLSQLSGAASGIANYAVLDLPHLSNYIGQQLWVWGRSDAGDQTSMRLGRNQITDVLPAFSHPALGSAAGDVFIFDYDEVNGLGADESRVVSGDSGGPSFVVGADGRPALVGIHWFRYDNDDFSGLGGSGDTLVPSFIDEVNAAIGSLGSSERLSRITAVPEPSSLWLCVLVGGWQAMRRRRRSS